MSQIPNIHTKEPPSALFKTLTIRMLAALSFCYWANFYYHTPITQKAGNLITKFPALSTRSGT